MVTCLLTLMVLQRATSWSCQAAGGEAGLAGGQGGDLHGVAQDVLHSALCTQLDESIKEKYKPLDQELAQEE